MRLWVSAELFIVIAAPAALAATWIRSVPFRWNLEAHRASTLTPIDSNLLLVDAK